MDVLTELKSADDAFMSASVPKTLDGKELEAFSLMRQAFALQIVGKQPIVFTDAVVKIWLCTLKPKAVVLASLDKVQALIDAFEWAEKCGFTINDCAPLLEIYNRIEAENGAAKTAAPEVNTEDGDAPKTDGGPPVS